MIFIIKRFRTIVFIVISTTSQPICPPALFRCLSNSWTLKELRTTSFIESTGVACSDSVSHNQVQVLSVSVLLLACSQDWICNLQMIVSFEAQGTNAYNRYAMRPAEFKGLINVMFFLDKNVSYLYYAWFFFLPVLIFRIFLIVLIEFHQKIFFISERLFLEYL